MRKYVSLLMGLVFVAIGGLLDNWPLFCFGLGVSLTAASWCCDAESSRSDPDAGLTIEEKIARMPV